MFDTTLTVEITVLPLWESHFWSALPGIASLSWSAIHYVRVYVRDESNSESQAQALTGC